MTVVQNMVSGKAKSSWHIPSIIPSIPRNKYFFFLNEHEQRNI